MAKFYLPNPAAKVFEVAAGKETAIPVAEAVGNILKRSGRGRKAFTLYLRGRILRAETRRLLGKYLRITLAIEIIIIANKLEKFLYFGVFVRNA